MSHTWTTDLWITSTTWFAAAFFILSLVYQSKLIKQILRFFSKKKIEDAKSSSIFKQKEIEREKRVLKLNSLLQNLPHFFLKILFKKKWLILFQKNVSSNLSNFFYRAIKLKPFIIDLKFYDSFLWLLNNKCQNEIPFKNLMQNSLFSNKKSTHTVTWNKKNYKTDHRSALTRFHLYQILVFV